MKRGTHFCPNCGEHYDPEKYMTEEEKASASHKDREGIRKFVMVQAALAALILVLLIANLLLK